MAGLEHVDYPHQGDGDLYGCPTCERIMTDKCVAFCAEGEGRCPACGEFVSSCRGHDASGDPESYRVLVAHSHNDHSCCAVFDE